MLKKIKSIFVVDDGSEPAVPSKDTDVRDSAPAPAPSASNPALEVSTDVPDTSGTNKFLSILAGVIEKNNQPGFDYFEFRQALINLSKLSMDEATKYKSAFAAAQSMNVSPAALVSSAQGYLKLLGDEGTKFAQAEQNQRTKVANDRQNEMNQIASDIKNKQGMISKLQQEVDQLTKTLEDKKTETANMSAKLASTKAAFEAAMKSIAGQINEDIQKMNQYLK
jgi:hypothetical protein